MNTNRTTRRLGTLALAGTIAAGAPFAAANPASAWSGCEGDCVASATITQRLDTKSVPTISITTTVPTSVLVIYKTINGTTAGAVSSSSTSLSTSHTLPAGAILTQGTGYVASIKATDQNGKSFTDTANVTALKRTLKFTVQKITITEDSDYGAGELRAGAKAGNAVKTLFDTRSISATKTLTLNKVVTDNAAPANAKVAVEIQDDDADIGEFCTGGTAFSFTSGSTSCMDWTSQSIGVDLQSTKGSLTRNFSFSANGRLKFKVWGTYTVTVA
jgi:uncharacterized cupredoxin-like copper-binding protein